MFLAIMDILDSQLFGILFWFAIVLVALVIEISTVQLVSIWFSGGALVSCVMAIFKVPFVWQVLAFVLTSTLLLLLSKFVFKKKLDVKETKTNADSLVGLELLVTSRVSDKSIGEGKIRDVVWSVVTEDTEPIESGEYAVIKKIDGNKLVVTRKDV